MATVNFETDPQYIISSFSPFKLVGDRLVVRARYQELKPSSDEWVRHLYCYDPSCRMLRPVISQHGQVVDVDVSGDRGVAICRDGEQFTLVSFTGDAENAVALSLKPDDSPRVLLDGDILVICTKDGVITRYRGAWQPLVNLNADNGYSSGFLTLLFKAKTAIWASYSLGEWGGSAYALDKATGRWDRADCGATEESDRARCMEWSVRYGWDRIRDISHSILAMAYDGAGQLWGTKGQYHFGDVEPGSLTQYRDGQWARMMPGHHLLPGYSAIEGMACMPTGEVRITASSLGLFEIQSDSLKPILSVSDEAIRFSSLVIDKEGRNFISFFKPPEHRDYYPAGILLAESKGSEISVGEITFNEDSLPMSLKDLLDGVFDE